ncbi:hypothetical protein PENTCL1PPCAC_16291, partial [Pristionchus entomophagus]
LASANAAMPNQVARGLQQDDRPCTCFDISTNSALFSPLTTRAKYSLKSPTILLWKNPMEIAAASDGSNRRRCSG